MLGAAGREQSLPNARVDKAANNIPLISTIRLIKRDYLDAHRCKLGSWDPVFAASSLPTTPLLCFPFRNVPCKDEFSAALKIGRSAFAPLHSSMRCLL